MNRKSFIQVALMGTVVLVGCRLTPSHPTHDVGLYPTPTVLVTQTERVLVQEVTTTPEPTQTPKVVEITSTPETLKTICVLASENVYLRPSPNQKGYPIMPLARGSIVTDLGGRKDGWMFVGFGDNQGWVWMEYLGDCATMFLPATPVVVGS